MYYKQAMRCKQSCPSSFLSQKGQKELKRKTFAQTESQVAQISPVPNRWLTD
jgi:hypothetical protein